MLSTSLNRTRREIGTGRRWSRRFVGGLMVLAVTGGAVEPAAAGACWPAPVSGTVVDPFRPPTCPWCAGNRGLEYRTPAGSTVRSVAAGEVTFSGVVAGTRFVVVELPSGWQITYGRLAGTNLVRGRRVVTGAVIGTVGEAFFFGVRVDGRYVDPARFIGRPIGRRRLVPIDGSAPRPAPPPVLRCRE